MLLGLAREGFVVSGCSPEARHISVGPGSQVPELAHLLETLNQARPGCSGGPVGGNM